MKTPFLPQEANSLVQKQTNHCCLGCWGGAGSTPSISKLHLADTQPCPVTPDPTLLSVFFPAPLVPKAD